METVIFALSPAILAGGRSGGVFSARSPGDESGSNDRAAIRIGSGFRVPSSDLLQIDTNP